MSRFMALALCFALPTVVYVASLKDLELSKTLEKVVKESDVGTPRAINEDIPDQGYTVEGNQLTNHLSVRASHAKRTRSNPDSVYSQLGDSVCSNTGYRQLLVRGVILTYSFTEYGANQPAAIERFDAGSCRTQGRKQARRAVAMLDKQHLLETARTSMPFDKYQGWMLVDLLEEYLLRFYRKGFPSGELGWLMQLTLELKISGLGGLLKPLRPPASQTNDVADATRRHSAHTQSSSDIRFRSVG